MRRLAFLICVSTFVSLCSPYAKTDEILVRDDVELRAALANLAPGRIVRIASGTYRGGHSVANVRGTAEKPIVIAAADPSQPPVFAGGGNAIHLSKVAYLTIDGLKITKSQANGLNIDDGGDSAAPSHHVVLKNLTIDEIGSGGNHDGIKLSGIVDFQVVGCRLRRWGRGGSGIDMVGCHRGEIRGCRFIGQENDQGNGVQAKGGSSEIRVTGCRFEHVGNRAVNIGGSTGLPYFRPQDAPHEAKDIRVEDCVFIGSPAPIAFVGVDGATVRHNTIHQPGKYVVRILQENTAERFAKCRNGVFERNLIVFDPAHVSISTNIGPNTTPESFIYRDNAWVSSDGRMRKPRHDIKEENATTNLKPAFLDEKTSDFRQRVSSPTKAFGARAESSLRP